MPYYHFEFKQKDLAMMKKCPACRGAKQVMQLGMSFGKCKTCLGVGEIKELSTDELLKTNSIENEIPPILQKSVTGTTQEIGRAKNNRKHGDWPK